MENETIVKQTTDVTVRATAMCITTQDQYVDVVNFVKDIKKLTKEIGETFEPIVKKAHAAWKEATQQMAKFLLPVETAEKILKQKMSTWTAAQEALRRAEENRIREAAQKAAEKEREKLAKKLDRKGDIEAAEEARAEEIYVPPVKIDAPVTEGVSYTERWKFDVISVDDVPREYMMVDTVKLGQVVRAMKGNVTIPGVKIWVERSPNVR